MVVLELQEFWRMFPMFYIESTLYYQKIRNDPAFPVSLRKLYFTNEQAEWNCFSFTENMLSFHYPKLKILLQRARANQSNVKRISLNSGVSTNNEPNLRRTGSIKRQTPSLVQPKVDSVPLTINMAFVNPTQMSNSNVTETHIVPPINTAPTSEAPPLPPSMPPKRPGNKVKKKPTLETKGNSAEKKDTIPPCPPSPATSIASLANLSILSNPTNHQISASSTPVVSLLNRTTSTSQKKLTRLNLQIQEREFLSNNLLKKSPMVKTPSRQRSISITDETLSTVKTQLFGTERDLNKAKPISNNKLVLLQR